ncbi:peroxisomal membrane anchor protein conserved region-domain-containing protein [Truncatella angustata]|uniref:Peroxisomal membrane protein PEX14 n=1 Tax=Truncatella angustata TaxID=152316 RepID=A0A9P9A0W2_9PEZI|nr:peroxisomal membrane anchor protein conserved region-domain-containing protein [Truncatella angustata]KAH6656390.1 peroxisomal membrane anchor protein conserved region-domain-containing protein [Truncatella angustata]
MADEKKDQPSSSEPEASLGMTLEDARKFLHHERAQSSSDEKKAEFLRSKGISDEDIEKLLKERSSSRPANAETSGGTSSGQTQIKADAVEPREALPEPATPPEPSSAPGTSSNETPPIITYPEFLTHSPKPPPLLTPSRLANGATVLASAWTLAYGVARFIVGPMVEKQSEARSEYYAHVNSKLSTLVEKLEGVVSEVPYKNGKGLKSEVDVDDDSSYDDPTEMFHRDIGTQTTPQVSSASSSDAGEKVVDKQAERLAQLTTSMKELSDMYISQAENTSELHSQLREFREEVDKLAYPSESLSYGGSGFGIGRSSEPDDEFKKTKDAIRSVKGMFLSSRMFPATTTR